jgi:hypothetical protein
LLDNLYSQTGISHTICCMDAATRSEFARDLARRRWGTRKLDGMIAELQERRAELDAPQVAAIAALLDDVDTRDTAIEER